MPLCVSTMRPCPSFQLTQHAVSTADLLQQGARLCPAFQLVRNSSKAYYVRRSLEQKRCRQLPGTWVPTQLVNWRDQLKSNADKCSWTRRLISFDWDILGLGLYTFVPHIGGTVISRETFERSIGHGVWTDATTTHLVEDTDSTKPGLRADHGAEGDHTWAMPSTSTQDPQSLAGSAVPLCSSPLHSPLFQMFQDSPRNSAYLGISHHM